MSTDQKKSEKTKNKQNKKTKKVLKTILLSFVFICITLSIVAGGYAYAVIRNAPKLDVNSVLKLSEPASIYDNKEELITTWHTDQQRDKVTLNEMSKYLKDAYISIEDERFYEHGGFDVKRIFGALYTDVKNKLSGKHGLHGASTLTQQLLKNTILTNDVTPERKITEIYLSNKLEKLLNKDQILEAYLNTIPLGGKLYGVEATAMYYFGKPAKDLNLIQSAYIAGITQAPSYYSAYTEKMKNDPTSFINRTKTVIDKMLGLGKISQEEHDTAINTINEKKRDAYEFKTQTISYKLPYEWFVNPAMSQVKQDLKNELKLSDDEVNKMLANGGLKIYTTMDKALQDHTQNVLDNEQNLSVFGKSSEKNDKGIYTLQASAVIMDYRTGEVKSMVGGRGDQGANALNRAYGMHKSIGSTTKPLTVYGPGIEMKKITPATGINDAPIPSSIGKKYSGPGEPAYNPKNSPNNYAGLISIRRGLRESKNVVAVLTEDKIGIKNGQSFGEQFGLKYNNVSKTSIAAVALGEFDGNPAEPDGGNAYILAQAYGTFGNSGTYTEGILYTKVVDASGKTLLEKKPATKNILSPQAAFITYDLLKEPVENYSAKGAKWGSMPVHGKTGTTTDSKNMLFAGLTPYLSGAVWVGYDQPASLKGYSGLVGTLWGKIMSNAHNGLEVKDIQAPNGVHKESLCSISGKKVTSACERDPRGNTVTSDWVIDGTESDESCDVHVVVKVNKLNGKIATSKTPANLVVERVFVKGDANHGLPKEHDDYQVPEKTPEKTPEKQDDTTKTDENKDKNKEDTKDSEKNDTPGSTNKPSTLSSDKQSDKQDKSNKKNN